MRALILATLTFACESCPAHDDAVSAAAAALLIERSQFFGNPSYSAGQISPDGKWLSWLAPDADVMNIWIAPTTRPRDATPMSAARVRPIRQYFWAPDSSALLFFNDTAGDENQVLYIVDLDSKAQRALTPMAKVRAELVAMSERVAHRILITINDRDPKWGDAYSLDLRTGNRTLVLENPGYARLIADRNLTVRLVSRPAATGGYDFHRVVAGRVEDAAFTSVGLEDSWITYPLEFAEDDRTLYWSDSRGRDTAAVMAQDMESGRMSAVAQSDKADIGSVLFHPRTGAPQAYAVNFMTSEWAALDTSLRGDLDFLRDRLQGEVTIASRSTADDKWIVSVDRIHAPATTYLYRRQRRSLTELFVTRPELDASRLMPMHPLSIRARDGLMLVSYLTLPPGSDPDGDGRPLHPVPLVLYPHGGPWSRDVYGFNVNHQWLANRGYAVLSVNFRGSRGFGKRFMSAGDRQWGQDMHDDLIDAVDWAVDQRIALREKVAIVGGSYGGYAVLAGLTFTPDRFACGVDMFGPSNLLTLLGSIPPHLELLRREFYARVGDPTTTKGRALLKAGSPLFRVNSIDRPLLIGQGANDPRVPRAESDQIVSALLARKTPVTYVLFPDEGHGFARPQNSIAFNAVIEQFLSRCLHGSAEPIGAAFKGSSITVVHGSEHIVGLDTALQRR